MRDIVDTRQYMGDGLDGELLLRVLLGAVNKRLDAVKDADAPVSPRR